MPVPAYRAPKDSKSWGLLGYLKDFISPPGYVARGPFGARGASAAEPQMGAAPTDEQLRREGFGFGVREYDPLQQGIKPAGYQTLGMSTPIVTGLTPSGEVDRRKSDEYKRFAMTPEGQFERYFKTPEMDQYFGAASRGAVAPQNVQAMQALAAQTTAPGKTPQELSAFYRAESAMGRAQMPEIQKSLGYGKDSALAEWAQANPMLAQRLYAKQQARLEAEGAGSPAVSSELGARAQSEGGYGGTFREQPGLFQAVGNPVVPTEDTAGTGLTQGERVDAGRGAQNLRPWQLAKTNPMNAASFGQ